MKITFFIILLALAGELCAQTLSPAVISSSGGFTANGTAMLSSTTGEMTMVETFNGTNVIITQGFQQPEDFNVSVKNTEAVNDWISIGPNPTKGTLQVFFHRTGAYKLKGSVTDVNGKLIFKMEAEKQASNNFLSFDLSQLSAGNYFLNGDVAEVSGNKDVTFSKKITLVK